MPAHLQACGLKRRTKEEHVVSRLSPEYLSLLRPEVGRPGYDRAQLRTGVVHLGLGAFHRAHQALYTEAVLDSGDARWGILGVSLRSLAVSDALCPQDGLYSVIERHGSHVHARVVGAMHRVLHAPTALAQVLEAIADPDVHGNRRCSSRLRRDRVLRRAAATLRESGAHTPHRTDCHGRH